MDHEARLQELEARVARLAEGYEGLRGVALELPELLGEAYDVGHFARKGVLELLMALVEAGHLNGTVAAKIADRVMGRPE